MKTPTSLFIALLLLPLAAAAQGAFVEGTHYQRVDPVQERSGDGPIEVIEVFWYGCPSCFNFEPHIQRWEKEIPDDVQFTRVAASMNPSWRVHARAFYAAEVLGVLDRVHDELFRAIHIERRQLNDGDALAKFFAEHGVSEEEFRRTYSSFAVETRMRRGDQLVRRYRLGGVPAVVVAGKYRTDPGMARSYERLVEIIDYLVEKERRAAATAG